MGHGLAWLLLQLWHCTDPLPHEVGVWLDLPPGSTYGTRPERHPGAAELPGVSQTEPTKRRGLV